MDPKRDIEAIEELRRRDAAAARAHDFDTLASLLTEDAVLMPPGGPAVRGRAEQQAGLAALREALAGVEVLDYAIDIEELTLLGDHAIEWGVIRGATRRSGGGPAETMEYKVLRVLKRQPDGSWKVHRSIWNEGV